MVFHRGALMKMLALDFGEKRIGLAVGDSTIGVAAARSFLINDAEIFVNLAKLVEHEGITKILVGLPLGLKNETAQTRSARAFAAKLDAKVAATVELLDERFTSKIAAANLRSAGENARAQKTRVDSESARIILQEYFDKNP
ncbi:MAG: Holliday junction resolvase RuvX [Patescibacteria group bacterium]